MHRLKIAWLVLVCVAVLWPFWLAPILSGWIISGIQLIFGVRK